MAETEARRPHPIVRRRACQHSFREHRGDSAQTEDIVCGIRSTYGGGNVCHRGGSLGSLLGVRATQGGKRAIEGLVSAPERGYVGLSNEVRRMAKGCSEVRQMVSTGRGGSRVIHAEMAGGGETQKLQSDTQRPWHCHPPAASLNSRGDGDGGRGASCPRD